MGEIRLADIVEPRTFTQYVLEKTKEKSDLRESGIIVSNDVLNSKAKSGGNIVDVPFWNDLANADPRIGTDNPADTATHQKITSDSDRAIVHRVNQSWSEMDLAVDVAGSDPMKNIGDRVAHWWTRAQQRMLNATMQGVLADNVANDSGDMLNSIYSDVASPAASNYISADAVIDAAQTLGDSKMDIAAIAMHSVVHARLQRQQQTDMHYDSDKKIRFSTYLGYRVIVDDSLPVIAGTNSPKYLTILFGHGAVGYGEGSPKTPTEVEREGAAGNGQGQEILYSRRNFMMHPMGIKFTGASLAGVSPTMAELKDATNWDRVRPERKQIPLAFLESNG